MINYSSSNNLYASNKNIKNDGNIVKSHADGFSELTYKLTIKIKNGRGYFDYKSSFLLNNKLLQIFFNFFINTNFKFISIFISFWSIFLIMISSSYSKLYSFLIILPIIILILIYLVSWYFYNYIPSLKYNLNFNNKKILKYSNNKSESVFLKDIKIGNLIKLKKNDVCYFDILLIESTDKKLKKKISYIDEKNIRDNFKLKEKEVIDLPNREFSSNEKQFLENNLNSLNAVVYYDCPDKDSRKFSGFLKINNDPKTIYIKKKNIIHKGSIIKSKKIYGMILVDKKLDEYKKYIVFKTTFNQIFYKGNYLFNVINKKFSKFLILFLLLNYAINFLLLEENKIFNIKIYSPPITIFLYVIFFELSNTIKFFIWKNNINKNMITKKNNKKIIEKIKNPVKKVSEKKINFEEKKDFIEKKEKNEKTKDNSSDVKFDETNVNSILKKNINLKIENNNNLFDENKINKIQINSVNKLNNLYKSNHFVISKKVISDLNSTFVIDHLITLKKIYSVEDIKNIKDIKEKKNQIDNSFDMGNISQYILNESYEEKSQEYLEEIQGNYTSKVMDENSNTLTDSYNSNELYSESKIITDISIPEIKIYSHSISDERLDKELDNLEDESNDDIMNYNNGKRMSILNDKNSEKNIDELESYLSQDDKQTKNFFSNAKNDVIQFDINSIRKIEELIVDCEKETKETQDLFECFLICNEILFKEKSEINMIDKTINEFCNKFWIFLEFDSMNFDNPPMELKIKIREETEFYYTVIVVNNAWNNKGRLSVLIQSKKHNKNNILYVRGKFKRMRKFLKLNEEEKIILDQYSQILQAQDLDLWIFAKKELNEKEALNYNNKFELNKNNDNLMDVFIEKEETDLDFIGMISIYSLYDKEFENLSEKILNSQSKLTLISNNNKNGIYSIFFKLGFLKNINNKYNNVNKIIYDFETETKDIVDKVINDIENTNNQENFNDKLNYILSFSGKTIDRIYIDKIIMEHFFFFLNFFKYFIIYNCSSEQKRKYIYLLKYYDYKRKYIIGIGEGLNDKLMLKESDVGFEIIKEEKKPIDVIHSDVIVKDFKSINKMINIYQNFFLFNKVLILEYSIIFWFFNSLYFFLLTYIRNTGDVNNFNFDFLKYGFRLELNILYYYWLLFTYDLIIFILYIKNFTKKENISKYYNLETKNYYDKIIKKIIKFLYLEIGIILVINFFILNQFFENQTHEDIFNYSIYSIFISNLYLLISNYKNINGKINKYIQIIFLFLYILVFALFNYFFINNYSNITKNYISIIIICSIDLTLIIIIEIIKVKVFKLPFINNFNLEEINKMRNLIKKNSFENLKVNRQISKILKNSLKNLNFLDNLSNKLWSNTELESEMENKKLFNEITLKINDIIVSFCYKIKEKADIMSNIKILGLIDIVLSIFLIISGSVDKKNKNFILYLGILYLVFSILNYLFIIIQIKIILFKKFLNYFEFWSIFIFSYLNKSTSINFFVQSYFFILLFKKFNLSIKTQIFNIIILLLSNFTLLFFFKFFYMFIYMQLILLFIIFSVFSLNYENKFFSKVDFINNNIITNIKKNYEDIIKIVMPDFIIEKLNKQEKGQGNFAEDAGLLNIIFCEVSNFDDLIKRENEKVVEILDELFRKFDFFCKEFGIQKIETVGKTYMACSGISFIEKKLDQKFSKIKPIKRIIHLSIVMQNYVEELNSKRSYDLKLRIGIHRGQCIFGVLGNRKPQFSLIGDAVNTTSRHCTKAEDGEVLLSEEVNDEINFKEEQEVITKNEHDMKGKGIKTVYKLNWKFILENKLYDINQILNNNNENNENINNKSYYDLFNIDIIDNLFDDDNDEDDEDDDEDEDDSEDILKKEKSNKEDGSDQIKKGDTKNMFTNDRNQIDIKENFFKVYFSKNYDNYQNYIKLKEKPFIIKILYNVLIMSILVIQIIFSFLSISNKANIYLIIYNLVNIIILTYLVLNLIIPKIFLKKIILFLFIKIFVIILLILKFVMLIYFSGSLKFLVNSNILLDNNLIVLVIESIFIKLCIEFIVEYSLLEHLVNSLIFLVFNIYILVKNQSLTIIYYIIFSIYNQILVYLKVNSNRKLQIKNHNLNLELQQKQTSLSKYIKEFLPKHIMDQIKKSNLIMGEKYENVTLLFADIVGFTAFSEKKGPRQVVEMLSLLFGDFDKNCTDLDLFKLFTIGDCYVTMSFYDKFKRKSIYEETKNTIKFAFTMIEIINKINQQLVGNLKMRIGIHNGDIIGGVIGTDIVRFDVYGENVLIANKMESNGEPNKVCVSEKIKKILKEEKDEDYDFKENKLVEFNSIEKKVNSYFIEVKEQY